jgi:hypothetical protein
MKFNFTGFPLLAQPLLDAADAGSGGGTDQGGGGSFGTDQVASQTATPDIPEFDDNAQIRFKGSDKPVAIKDVRNFQSQWTRSAQEAARVKQALQQREAELARYKEQERLAQQRSQQQGNNNQGNLIDALRSKPYLSGEEAAEIVSGLVGQFQQRDQIMVAALQEIQRQQAVINQLNSAHVGGAFDAKISKWVSDMGLPPEAAELAKDIYLAYEGDNLDDEFPRIFQERWQLAERLINAKRERELRETRKQPFVPGRGGNGNPSKPLTLDPAMSAKDTAEALWASLQTAGT